jgi:acetyltransferase-like isoleucine patch superfamily enzyme
MNQIGRNAIVSDKARVVDCVLRAYSRVKDYAESVNSELGSYSYIAQFSIVNKSIIGKFCSIGHGSYIGLWEHNTYVSTHSFYLYETSGNFVKGYKSYDKDCIVTRIGNDVWIGANVVVLKGVEIGDGAIIGAGAVVTKNIPPYAIAVGNPAKVKKLRFSKKDIEFLLRIKWWDSPRSQLQIMVDEGAFYSIDKLKKIVGKRKNS